MKLTITIDIDASETIINTIKRGNFSVNKDGTGHKMIVGHDVIVPSRKCSIKYFTDKEIIEDESPEICGACTN